jgi:hypothetical protein
MRIATAVLIATIALSAQPAQVGHAQSCVNDYITVETFRGTVIDIKPAPEPFKTADIYLSGPSPCERMWMQVLKSDAEKCRIGDSIEVTGVVTADAENNSWEIGPAKNDYMTLGDDFTCR